MSTNAENMFVDTARVKLESESDGASSSSELATGPNTGQGSEGYIKDEVECTTEAVQVKQEPWCDLYTDHVLKDELVLGPECVQQSYFDIGVNASQSLTSWTDPSPSSLDFVRRQSIIRDCCVRIERLPEDEPGCSTWRKSTPVRELLKNCWVKLERLPHNKMVFGNQHKKTQETHRKQRKSNKQKNDGKLKCDVCNRMFTTEPLLTKHLLLHIYMPLSLKKEERTVIKDESNNLELKRIVAAAHKISANRATLHHVPKICATANAQKNTLPQDIKADTINNASKTYVCNTCGRIFQHKSRLIDHFKVHLRGKSFSNNTYTKTSLKIRKKEQSNTKSKKSNMKGEECETCKKVFTSKYKLNIHQRIHTGERPYSCEICERTFTTKNGLESHVRTHTREQPYSCNVCQKKFSQSTSLKIHKRVHTGEKPYSCKICYKVFTQSGHLKTHEKIHTGIKPHACQICNKKFIEPGKLRIHELIHSGGKPQSCEICDKKFRQLAHLYRHKLTHSSERPYFCDICEKNFKDSGQLRQHKLIHKGIKPYACKICKKQFIATNNLKKHLRIHTGEKPYSCDICKKQCSEFGSLKVHMRTHTGERPYSCEICLKKFSYSSSLKAHTRYHTREMFTCGTCLKQFARSGDLKKHERAHSGQKRYSCDICAFRFHEKYTLARHLRTHEKNKRK